jgi:hypothetical protein
MIQIGALTPELLAELSKEICGFDFTHESQVNFLSHTSSCDVQAVPGNGKTTLLVAKLALLSREWRTRTQGICVISHTNAARIEIETKLLEHPKASAFLNYPHFVGTVTTFINQYLALPYLRGLGWAIRHIDDEAFAAEAIRRIRTKSKLVGRTKMQNGAFRHQVESWVSKLELATDFDCHPDKPPSKLKVVTRRRQHGPQTDCGIELEELKASLVNSGLFRFSDMTVLATKALDASPTLKSRLCQRFPLVMLDEAQDTNGPQMKILQRLFGDGSVAYQRLGDQNQTLYEDDELDQDDYWSSGASVIPLTKTRRFGVDIAAFASRLAVRAKQDIEGVPGLPSRRSLLLFDRATILGVIPAYAREVRAHWGTVSLSDRAIWAVASRHSLYKPRGSWPKSLVDYHPNYRTETGNREKANIFCCLMQKASLLYAAGKPGDEILDMFTTGLVAILRAYNFRGSVGEQPTIQNVWRILRLKDPRAALRARRIFRDEILYSNAAWDSAAWIGYCKNLRDALGLSNLTADSSSVPADFLAFVEDKALKTATEADRSTKEAVCDDVVVKLGSVHSVKGKTVDAILVVESEIWKGTSNAEQLMDLAAVLPHAFGVEQRDFSRSRVDLTAATNLFVAVTRPRELLSLAMRRDAASSAMLDAARLQGWHIVDLTTSGASNVGRTTAE